MTVDDINPASPIIRKNNSRSFGSLRYCRISILLITVAGDLKRDLHFWNYLYIRQDIIVEMLR